MKSRKFNPGVESLEALNLVSVIALGLDNQSPTPQRVGKIDAASPTMPAVNSLTIQAGTTQNGRIAPLNLPAASRNSHRSAQEGIETRIRGFALGTPTIQLKTAKSSTGLITVPSSEQINGESQVTHLQPAPTVPKSNSGGGSVPVEGGVAATTGGGPAKPSQAAAAENGGNATFVGVPASNGGGVVTGSQKPAQNSEGAIRPMTAGPLTGGHGVIHPNGGSGDPDPPANLAPTISLSGASLEMQSSSNGTDTYSVSVTADSGAIVGNLPVGWNASFTTGVQAGFPNYVISSYLWSNGYTTNYFPYFSAKANSAATAPVSASTNVPLNQSTFKFILPPTPQAYSVQIVVNYTNGASGTDIVNFSSVAPTGSLASDSKPAPAYLNPPLGPALAYWDAANAEGQVIKPTTTTTDANWGGTFMIMQTVVTTRVLVPQNGVPITKTTNGSPYLDNGTVSSTNTYGMKNTSGGFDWSQGPGTQSTAQQDLDHAVSDPVIVPPKNVDTDQSVTVGTLADPTTTPPTPAKPESFVSYLMYQPNVLPASWVAIAKLAWGWGGQIVNNNGTWSLNAAYSQNPAKVATAPIPANAPDYFPSWTGLTSTLTW